jgi:hypothetical protein
MFIRNVMKCQLVKKLLRGTGLKVIKGGTMFIPNVIKSPSWLKRY